MSLADKLLGKISKKVKTRHDEQVWRGTFQEYLEMVAKNPEPYLRTSYQYIYDAIRHLGVDEIKDCGEMIPHYNIFEDPFNDGRKKMFGIDRVLESFVDEIRSSAMEEGPERIILLHGPPGTGKSSIFNMVSQAMESYSRSDGGEIFRFKWHISGGGEGPMKKRLIGYQMGEEEEEEKSQQRPRIPKHMELSCQLNDNPLFLLSREDRSEFLQGITKGKRRDIKIPNKILDGDLCYNCQQIYSSLLDRYDGDLEKVFKHVVVERFVIRDNQGFILIEPGTHEDPYQRLFQMQAEQLARMLPGVVIQPLGGRWSASNRGFIHFSDIFKSGDSHHQLLSASEEHRVSIGGVCVTSDTLIGGTCNLAEYEQVRSNPITQGLRDRIRRFSVNYVLNFEDEAKIYLRDFGEIKGKHIAPHAVQLSALWAVLTRLDKPIPEGIPDDAEIDADKEALLWEITPMQKAELYAGKKNHELDYFDDVDRSHLDDSFRAALRKTEGILAFHQGYEEGTFGISPRKIQDIFKRILKKGECLDPVTVLEGLEDLIVNEKKDHDFLKWEVQVQKWGMDNKAHLDDYFDSFTALAHVREYYERQIFSEVCFALLDIKPEKLQVIVRDYMENLERTVLHVRVGDDGHPETDADQNVLEFIESKFNLEPDSVGQKSFRTDLITQFHRYLKEFPPEETGGIDYARALPEFYEKLKLKFFVEKYENIDFANLREGIARFGTKDFNDLEWCVRRDASRIMNRMKDYYGYCDICAKRTLLYTFPLFERKDFLKKK